ncbi:hypothetical protein BOSEA1005_20118 [Hyphomicrobiales bacterium]|nr:hypothetical protein BOSEA1005_20118 [Hyphomicrobiales bacterium]CAI0344300.1 hypothetical protein BO1005MUT1_320130 [Hyphomicrobiales bacterium]
MAEAIRSTRMPSGRNQGVWLLVILAAAALFGTVVATRPSLPGSPELVRTLESILLWHSLMPRAVRP